jgi:alcohol dehydrogenase
MHQGSGQQEDEGIYQKMDLPARPTRLVQGEGVVRKVGKLAKELGGTHALIVTDQGIVAAGHFDVVADALTMAGIQVSVYDLVRENPTTRDVAQCLDIARRAEIDLIVGLGGGSSMDTAKGCNFILTNGGEMKDYWGRGKATKPMLPLIAIPTTTGTGSECQSFALIADELTHMKMACGDPKAAAKISLLDPMLTLSQPLSVASVTGIDALSHAVETAVSNARNPISLLYAREAFKRIHKHLPSLVHDPKSVKAHAELQMGAALAGMAIENSMLGAAHSCANPLTAHYGTVHGLAVGVMLPHVVRFNAGDAETAELYEALALYAGLDGVESLIARINELLNLFGMLKPLRELNVIESEIPVLAQEAKNQWTALFNPRSVEVSDFEELFRAAY